MELGMEVHPLSPALGARVDNVDLVRDAATLRDALRAHHLLLFRGREIGEAEHLVIAAVFGRIAQEKSGSISVVSNQPGGGLGPDAASWHSDFTFFPAPYECISLYGVEIPAEGTHTAFANGVLAARTLPEDLRARVDGLQARSVTDIARSTSKSECVRYRLGRCDGIDPHQLRPVLWPHPVTGDQILAVWEQQTDAILPLAQDESVALIEVLFAHLYQPAHVYMHDWQRFDLLLWDNLALQHSRPYVGVEQARILRRVSVGDDQDISQFVRRAGAAA
jgi:taurine dioxygenase